MFTSVLKTEESSNKVGAYLDARMRNLAGKSHYSYKDQTRAERMKLVLELVYTAKEIYINYRAKFIAVKVDGARVADKVSLSELEAEWADQGITKAVSAQGVVYRIPKL
jgi:hypothetical protein